MDAAVELAETRASSVGVEHHARIVCEAHDVRAARARLKEGPVIERGWLSAAGLVEPARADIITTERSAP